MVTVIDKTKWNADAMRAAYQRMVDTRVAKIESGKYPGIQEGRYRLVELLQLEELGAIPSEVVHGINSPFVAEQIAGSPLRQLRQQALSGMVYQSLTSLDDRVRETLAVVDDPILNEFLPLFEKTEKGDAGLHAFQNVLLDTGTDNHFMEVLWYVRTLGFLEIAQRHPDKSDRFDENSSHFPQQLFYPPKQKSVWENVEAEIAEAFLSIIPPSITDAVEDIGTYITPSEHTEIGHTRGRFRIPLNVRLAFPPEADAAKIDARYNTPDLKRTVYETLHRYLKLSSKLSIDARVRAKDLKKYSTLGLSKTEYRELARNISNYACNQILNVWLTDGVIPAPGLAARLGLRATSDRDGTTLTITDPLPYRGTQRFTKDSKSFDTTAYLPFCVAILNRVYRAAQKIQAEVLQRQEAAATISPTP